MRIDGVNVHKVSLPFLRDFSHSRKKGRRSRNIVVEIMADGGRITGYGEGAPREYVTGESQESAAHNALHMVNHRAFPSELRDISQIWDFVHGLSGGKEHNAALCAVEMALLDALGKKDQKPLIDFFRNHPVVHKVFYGATIPLAKPERVTEICRLIGKLGINKLRLKMGRDFAQNRDALEAIMHFFGDDYDLRVDINGAWDRNLAFRHLPLLSDFKVRVVEQPMMPGDTDIRAFADVLSSRDMILMADESVCSLEEAKQIIEEGCYRMVNVRLSKCGGFLNAMNLIEYLREHGLAFQIGCQLGESGLLSSAGRTLGLLCRDARYYDGSYDALLLEENVTVENVSFGPGGEARPLTGPGLGVAVSKKSLHRLSEGSAPLTADLI